MMLQAHRCGSSVVVQGLVMLLLAGCSRSAESETPVPAAPALAQAAGPPVERVRSIVANQMGMGIQQVKPGTSLGDLKADELDLVELVMELEYAFQVTVADEKLDQMAGGNIKTGMQKFTVQELANLVEELKAAAKP